MSKRLHRIARHTGREIGLDLLVVNRAGMYFSHPMHMQECDTVFEDDLRTCLNVASKIPDCFVINHGGQRVG